MNYDNNQIPQKSKQSRTAVPAVIFISVTIVLFTTLSSLVIYEKFFVANKEIKNREVISLDNKMDTSDWKTYKSDKYGYEIKYPAESNVRVIVFTALENKNYIATNFSGNEDHISIEFDGGAVDVCYTECGPAGIGADNVKTTEKVNIMGRKMGTTGFINENGRGTAYLWVDERVNNKLQITYRWKTEEARAVAYKIIASLNLDS